MAILSFAHSLILRIFNTLQIPVEQIELLYDNVVIHDNWCLCDIPAPIAGIESIPIIMQVKAQEVEFQATRKFLRQLQKSQRHGEELDKKLEEFQQARLTLLKDMAAKAALLDRKQKKVEAELGSLGAPAATTPAVASEEARLLSKPSVLNLRQMAETQDKMQENSQPLVQVESEVVIEEKIRRVRLESQMVRIDLKRARINGRIKKMQEEIVSLVDLRADLEVMEKEYIRAARVLENETGQFAVKATEQVGSLPPKVCNYVRS